MHRIIRIGLFAFAALALVVPLAFSQSTVSVGKKGEVEFTANTRVGSTVLEPGHYQFQHQSIDGQHYLVVRVQTTAHLSGSQQQHYAGATKGEVARVPCRLVTTATGRKIAQTSLHTRNEAGGVQTVTQIDIRGEKDGHVVTLEPQS